MKQLQCSDIFAFATRNVFVKQSNGTYIDIGDVIRTALLITFFLTGGTSLRVQNNPFGTEFTTLYQMQRRQVNHSQFDQQQSLKFVTVFEVRSQDTQ